MVCDGRVAATIFDWPAQGPAPASALLGLGLPGPGCEVVPGHGLGCSGDACSENRVGESVFLYFNKKLEERDLYSLFLFMLLENTDLYTYYVYT